jgi:hypothetical protein
MDERHPGEYGFSDKNKKNPHCNDGDVRCGAATAPT